MLVCPLIMAVKNILVYHNSRKILAIMRTNFKTRTTLGIFPQDVLDRYNMNMCHPFRWTFNQMFPEIKKARGL